MFLAVALPAFYPDVIFILHSLGHSNEEIIF